MVKDNDVDAAGAVARKMLVFTASGFAGGLAAVKVAQYKLPFACEIMAVNVATATDAGGNSVDVKIGANSALAAAIVPAAGHVAGVLHATASRRKVAKNTSIDVVVSTAGATTWPCVTISYRPQGLKGG